MPEYNEKTKEMGIFIKDLYRFTDKVYGIKGIYEIEEIFRIEEILFPENIRKP